MKHIEEERDSQPSDLNGAPPRKTTTKKKTNKQTYHR